MKYNLHQIEPVKKFLSDEFWSEKRWVVFDVLKHIINVWYIECFFDYQIDTEFCITNRSPNQSFKIKALCYLLKLLNKGKCLQPTSREEKIVTELLEHYPVTIFYPGISLIAPV